MEQRLQSPILLQTYQICLFECRNDHQGVAPHQVACCAAATIFDLWSGLWSGMSLKSVLDHFDLPSLRYLLLSRYVTNERPGPQWKPIIVQPVSQVLLDRLLPPRRLYTGSVTSMVLHDPSAPPDISAHFLRWSRRLEQLSLLGLSYSLYSREHTLPAVQKMLNAQHGSLKRIHLGMFNGGPPDFSAFPCLEWLSMSMQQTRNTNLRDVFRKLTAPRLRFVRIDFNTEDQHREHYTSFAQPQVDWFSDLAACKTKDAAVASCLETISILFNPAVGTYGDIDDSDYPWPWDYLEEATRRVSEYGINLVYNDPGFSRHEWYEWKELTRAESDIQKYIALWTTVV
ncbi:hypothetical protein MMC14_003102 [Varicellaria rhodocarpa]|nr:hypothetical protein [Varicellaria rhodocarpa]